MLAFREKYKKLSINYLSFDFKEVTFKFSATLVIYFSNLQLY